MKLLLAPVLTDAACLLAGLCGAIRNQISYSDAPECFRGFKFRQFAIPADWQNRLGASVVGWRASWWMGLILAPPLVLASLAVRGTSGFVRAYLHAALAVIFVTLLTGLDALLFAYVTITPDTLPVWVRGRALTDPVAFARAGTMHNASYLGALLGLLAGLALILRAAIRSRRG